ncbi:hypothetical protein pdam_00006650 [Pocillopora damicornis]|uniref:Uncharacterized protein n=1 Tax=Pocillopora damicornis TaxID=46731 RepID=A0A3M6TKK1_POCDA|nr:hypothetical protein pdam_00006650 [Pocillopora damicornis]
MNSEKDDKNTTGCKVQMTTENAKPNRYELYGKSETGKVVDANLKTSPSPNSTTNTVGLSVLSRGNPRERGFTLHVKELVVPGKDYGNLNSALTAQRPRSAISAEQSNFCSLFGISLSQPLKYSRNAVNIKEFMGKQRRSSCSDLTKRN